MIVKKSQGLSIRANNRGSRKMKIETLQFTFGANNKGSKKMIETLQLMFGTNHWSVQLRQLMWGNAWMFDVWKLELYENHWMPPKTVGEQGKI